MSLSSHSTRLLAATTLRNVLGTKNLSEILSEREVMNNILSTFRILFALIPTLQAISHVMQNALDEATDPWGVKVERVEM